MSTFTTIQSCRVCGGSELEVVLDLGEQALTGRFPRQATEQITKGPLCVVRCQPSAGGCGLVQLRETFDPGEMYGETYGYRSGLNLSMVRHLQGKADRIRQTVGDIRGLVLDIGSNDCTFLKAMDKPNVELIGIDPAAAKFSEYYPSHVRSLADFFSAASFHGLAGNRKAAVVTSFAMFYDLEAPIEFAREIASILEDDGIWVFEQSYLPMMLTHNSYDTVCHEHSEYYALRQILFILKKAGLKAVDIEFNEVNGGSFSVMATHLASQRPECLQKIGTALDHEDRYGVTGGGGLQGPD